MASNQRPEEEYLKQVQGKGRQGMEDGNESEAELGIRRNAGFQSSFTRRENAVSDFRNATGSQDYDRRPFRRDNINDSTRTARNRAFDGRFVESGSEASSFVNQPRTRRREEFQGLMTSRHAQNIGQHRHQPSTARTGLDRGHNPQLTRQEEQQARPNQPNLREQASEAGRKTVNKGAYWKPSPGAGCQKAPPPGGSRGFNPSGTVPDYGGLEIWHDDDGKIVERRGRGGKDDGSFHD